MNKPFFTIITVVLNGEKHIERCIKSVVNQTFIDFEYLIIDGKSSDATNEIISNYTNDNRIRHYSETDFGIYDAMNKALKLSNGNWIYFLGYDDYFIDNNVLFDISNSIKTNVPDIIYGKVIWGETNHEFGKSVQLNDLKNEFICHQSIFIQKKIFKQVGDFDLKFKYNADAHLIIRCFHLKTIKTLFVDRVIAYYNIEGVSTLNTDDQFVKYKYTFFNSLTFIERIKKYYFLYKPKWFKPSRIFKN